MPLLPSKEKTGLIAAVGIDDTYRGRGVGVAMMVEAVQRLQQKGMEGILIDWVPMTGFYEKLGFKTHWSYEGYVYKATEEKK